MAGTKKDLTSKWGKRLVFSFLILFPFGHLIRLGINVSGVRIPVHPIDIIAGLSLLLFVIRRFKTHKISKYIFGYLLVAFFSLLLSFAIFNFENVIIGILYFIRFISYAFLFLLTLHLVKNKHLNKKTLFYSLIAVSAMAAILGWIQYFWVPDLRTLKLLGWDDHYYRLTGTFFDPGFTGIILTLGFIASANKYFKDRDLKFILLSIFFLISVIFTYSRASYLALFTGLFFSSIIVKKNVKKLILIVFLLFLIIIPFFPRNLTEGALLERTHSIFAKVDNYKQTWTIIQTNPVFGVGFNNLCLARSKYVDELTTVSHSCSGSDSSLLTVTAMTGFVGLMIYLYMGFKILSNVGRNVFGVAFLSSSAALFIHSLFFF